MTAMLHPGVYVQEIPSGSRSIEGAPTSTAIFVGETERGPVGPTKIKGPTEYTKDAFHRFLIDGEKKAISPVPSGTKTAADFYFVVPPGESNSIMKVETVSLYSA